MALTHLIVIDPKSGERVTSYVVPIHGKTYEVLLDKAQADYPGYLYLRDNDGELQAILTRQDAHWFNNKVQIRPSQIHDWDGSAWVINEEKKAELLKNQQSATWEHIKAERTRRTEGGVYVKSVDKWFHTDQPSRIQYLSIQQMPTLPESFAWKTMDNTFVNMTKALIDELILSLRIKEQADFANAERHKAAMLESDNPADYDYSAGWSDIYDE